jgi:hypothetical protein
MAHNAIPTSFIQYKGMHSCRLSIMHISKAQKITSLSPYRPSVAHSDMTQRNCFLFKDDLQVIVSKPLRLWVAMILWRMKDRWLAVSGCPLLN